MKKISCLCMCLGLIASASGATVTYSHSGNVNPETEGWQAFDIVGGINFDHTTRATIGPVSSGGVDAWRINDDNDGTNYTSVYRITEGNTPINLNNYWRMSAHVQGGLRDETIATSHLNGNMRLSAYRGVIVGAVTSGVIFDASITDDEVLISGTRSGVSATVAHSLSPGFNWVEILYNPNEFAVSTGGVLTNSGASLFINGQFVESNLPITETTNISNIVSFGDQQQVGNSWGGADWGDFEFTRSDLVLAPIGIPEPSSSLLLALCGLLCFKRTR